MASFTDAIPQFNPYIQQLPVEAMVSVGMQKQQQYDQGIQRIQSEIDRVAGLDIVRDVDRKYLQTKLNDLGSKLRTVAAGDFSNFQLVNSVAGMAGKVAKDNNVINAVQATAKYRKEQTFMEEARQKGESAIQNEYDFMQQTNRWLNDENVGAGFSGRYRKYIDVDKKWLDVMKTLHPDLLEEDIPYAYNKDGSINVNETAAAMQRISKEGVSAEKIQNALRASLSPDELEQLNINGRYEFRNIQDPTQLAAYATSKNSAMLRQNNEEIERLKGVMKMYESDPEKYTKAEQGIKSLEAINKGIQDDMNYELDMILKDPEAAKGYIYRRGAIEQFASAHAWEKQKNNLLTSPLREDYWKSKEFAHKERVQSWAETKDRYDMMDKDRSYQLKMKESFEKMYGSTGAFQVWGGKSTKVPDPKGALLKDMDVKSRSIDNQVNALLNQLNSSGEGKVERVQVLNALDAYMRGDVSTYESLIPDHLSDFANSIISEKADLNRKEEFWKTVQQEALKRSNSKEGTSEYNAALEAIMLERGIQFIPREVPIIFGTGEGNIARSTWEGITTSVLRKAAETSLSGMRGGYEGLDADDAEEALAWFAPGGDKNDIMYKKLEQGDQTSLVIMKGGEEFVIPLTPDEAAQLPINDPNSPSPQYRRLMEAQSMGSGNTNPSGKFENSYFDKLAMPRVNLNVRADMTSSYGNPGKQFITLRLKLPDGTVYPLQTTPVDPTEGMKIIANLTDAKIKQLYLDSRKVSDSIKEVIRNM
jgi:hypothetical protein